MTSEQRTVAATIAAIVVSSAVALPAQALWFLDKLVGRRQDGRLAIGLNPQTLMAFSSPVLVEGMAWYCAHLYAESVQRGAPQRLYRAGTLAFSCFAASINYSHGAVTNTAMGLVFALASLMGVGAWELYMLRSRHIATGMTGEEIKLWALRWRKHPRVMREASRIRATFGLAVPREVAWRMAYVRKSGNPTVPVALTDEVLSRLFVSTVEPTPEPEATAVESSAEEGSEASASTLEAEPGSGTPGGGVATAEVLELPVGWDTMASADELIERFWPEVKVEVDDRNSSAEDTSGSATEFRSSSAESSARKPQRVKAEQRPTSKVPVGKRNSDRNRNSVSRVQFRPTDAELSGSDDAKARIVRYLKRAEAKGHSIPQLDRKYIAEQFRVGDRQVRNAIKAHKEGTQS
jgi:hypothetical protein